MVPVTYNHSKQIIRTFFVFVFASSFHIIFPTMGYLDINQYCKAFDVNFRPIICIIKNGTQTAPPNYYPSRPPQSHPTMYPILQPPASVDYTDIDDDEDECSCEVRCVPRIVHQRSLNHNSLLREAVTKKRAKRTTSTSYRCRSCGTECPVSTTRPPTCSCVIPANRSECACNATCAIFRRDMYYFHNNNDDLDDANCILSVSALEDWRLGEERPPYTCDCKRSKEAENTSRPDFICICQRVSRE